MTSHTKTTQSRPRPAGVNSPSEAMLKGRQADSA